MGWIQFEIGKINTWILKTMSAPCILFDLSVFQFDLGRIKFKQGRIEFHLDEFLEGSNYF